MTEDDAQYMRKALEAATANGTDPSRSPIGCVIVMGSRIVSVARNRVDETNDPTAHAEIVAIREAARLIGSPDLRGATVYST